MENIMVSVLCLAYNHEKYIYQALHSMVSQKTNFRFEILVHDDASTDKTTEIIREFEKKYPDIVKPIYQKENQYSKSVSIFEEFLIPKAKGKYFALCECDDFWTSEEKLQKQVDYMENHPECSLCIHNAIHVDVDNNLIGRVQTTKGENRKFSCEEVILGDGHFCATNSILAPLKYIKEGPEYFKKLPLDYIWQIRLASEGEVYCFKEEMSAYRVGVANSWTEKMTSKCAKKELATFYRKINETLAEFDELTKYKYHEAVFKSQTLREFQILYMERKFNELKKEPYINCVSEIQFTTKMRIIYWLGMHCPKVLDFLEKIIY